jgi:hypothetical protein
LRVYTENLTLDSYGDETDVDDVDFDTSMFGHDMNCHGCKWKMVAPIIVAQLGDALTGIHLSRAGGNALKNPLPT